MALIKIADLNPDHVTSDCGLIELQPIEAASIQGGRSRRSGRHAAKRLMSALTSQISLISSVADQASNTLKITTPAVTSSNNGTSVNINGVNITTTGNLFYTDSEVSPIGAEPIPGVPGAYTF